MRPRLRPFLDDRGREVSFPALASLDELEDEREELEEDDGGLEELLARINPCNPEMRTPLTGGQIAWVCFSGLFWFPLFWLVRREPFYVKCVLMGGVIIAVMAIGQAYRKRWLVRGARELRQIVLEMRRCPSCTHSLEGLPRHEDGCVVCPECGSAWQTADPSTPHPPVA